MTYCLVIPHYNHQKQLATFLPGLLQCGLPCIIVDDGSDNDNLRQLEILVRSYNNIYLCKHVFNRGKGAAVKTGFCYAGILGFTHAIQIDADGQHDGAAVLQFVDVSKNHPDTIICGRPVFDESVPKVRLYGRKVTDFWVALETLSFAVKDGLCGFRVYPLEQFEKILDRYYAGSRMDFDTEVLVKAVWAGVPLKFIDTAVSYPEDGASHFRYLRDNLMLIALHTRLMLGMLARSPWLVFRRITRK